MGDVAPRRLTFAAAALPALPGIALELLRALDDEALDTKAVARRIGHGPVLSARVLRIANSPFYGLPGQISSLAEAVMVLGFSTVRNLALAASVSTLPSGGESWMRSARPLWRHSFCCALCAEALAERVGVSRAQAFSAGLLHDIGLVAQLAADPQGFGFPCAARGADGVPVDMPSGDDGHAVLGARLLEEWRLPDALVRAARFHHDPDGQPADRLTQLVCLADVCTHLVHSEAPAPWNEPETSRPALARLHLTAVQCRPLLQGVPAALEALSALLS